MLKTWSVSNFKSIKNTKAVKADGTERNELELKPLTIFCGANSSGKSSLIQSILLMAQTMRHRDKQFPLILNGVYANLGTTKKVSTNSGNGFNIAFSYEPSSRYWVHKNSYPFTAINDEEEKEKLKDACCIKKVSFESRFSFVEDEPLSKILPCLQSFDLKFYFCDVLSGDKPIYELKYTALPKGKEEAEIDEVFSYLEYPNNDGNPILKPIAIKNEFLQDGRKKCDLTHFFPVNVYYNIPNEELSLAFEFDSLFPDNNQSECVKYLKAYTSPFTNPRNMTGIVFKQLKNILSGIDGIDDLFEIASDSDEEAGIVYDVYDAWEWQEKLNNLDRGKKETVIKEMLDHEKEIKKDIEEKYREIKKRIKRQKPGFFSEDYEPCDYDDYKLWNIFCGTTSIPPNASFLRKLLTEMSDLLTSKIFYLGPLREDPKELYFFSSSPDSFELGKKGENLATILELFGGKKIDNIPVPLENTGKPEKKNVPLMEAVNEWLKYIGAADEVTTACKDFGITLEVKAPGSAVSSYLTNVGIGVSQVLPIVVLCLFAEKGSTLIFEQPELHLHPKMQTRLMDFFIAISRSGRQCIIETHSEQLIDKTRLRIAQAPLKQPIQDKIAVYFTEKHDRETQFRRIEINEYSVMSEWPEGFFDESIKLAEDILHAARIKEEESEERERKV
jgi:predicted ATPase